MNSLILVKRSHIENDSIFTILDRPLIQYISLKSVISLYEPRCEKTDLWGF